MILQVCLKRNWVSPPKDMNDLDLFYLWPDGFHLFLGDVVFCGMLAKYFLDLRLFDAWKKKIIFSQMLVLHSDLPW